MANEKIKRKIAVIFAADVVDYSKHMETDENSTVRSLRECEQILKNLFSEFDGRLFNTGGDSFFAEFSSAVSAVECAEAFQSQIMIRNKSADPKVKLQFRIGINSGDVIEEKRNLLGDGVNIASRLESLAQPNGVTISKTVYDFVEGKTNLEFHDLGVQKIKKNEFHAFDILLNSTQKRQIRRKTKTSQMMLAVAGLVFVALVLVNCNFPCLHDTTTIQNHLIFLNPEFSSQNL